MRTALDTNTYNIIELFQDKSYNRRQTQEKYYSSTEKQSFSLGWNSENSETYFLFQIASQKYDDEPYVLLTITAPAEFCHWIDISKLIFVE